MQSNKKVKNKNKQEGCATGLVVGSLLRTVTEIIVFLLRVVGKILLVFGLWVPAVYALFGLILHLAFKFNPFDFSLYSTIYLSGAVACVICSLIISVKNLVLKPAQSVYKGYKKPIWSKQREEIAHDDDTDACLKNRWEVYNQTKLDKSLNPPEIPNYVKEKQYPLPEFLPPSTDFEAKDKKETKNARLALFPTWLPKKNEKEQAVVASTPAVETPTVYFSKLEPSLLVHEYSDRFELYRLEGNKTIPVRVEYK